jgi:hypothetical protein
MELLVWTFVAFLAAAEGEMITSYLGQGLCNETLRNFKRWTLQFEN